LAAKASFLSAWPAARLAGVRPRASLALGSGGEDRPAPDEQLVRKAGSDRARILEPRAVIGAELELERSQVLLQLRERARADPSQMPCAGS